jgi:hypothetical protein
MLNLKYIYIYIKYKGLKLNTTYKNDKSARNCIHLVFIAKSQISELQPLLEKSKYFFLSVQMFQVMSKSQSLHWRCNISELFVLYISDINISTRHLWNYC